MKEARKVTKHLLKKKLIACANIYNGVRSLYPWAGQIVEEKETVIIAKTVASHYELIVREVKKIHSYRIPCVIKIHMTANPSYGKWLMGNLKE